ncbi:Structural protein [Rhodovulum sp. P5]|uniref:ABC transporter permease n=1 Tax=Rhodovulum sp. P5 TaxID=1564506 RepID=UPI0009C32730|nr:ABC transporter permease [Rhodovulum sp. P5]ARE41136.1 Structural protein [Rhodovulum sp. P5]
MHRVIGALVVREMITRYGRSPGGYIWAILEPAGMVAMLAIVFSQFIHSPPLGKSFILFYATGYIPFHAYSDIAGVVSKSVSTNRSLMQFPMVTPLDAIIARFILSVLTIMVVSVLVFATLLVIVDDPVRLSLGPILVGLFSAMALGLGVGTINAFIFAFVPVWQQIWGILNRPMFIISAVFFTYESLPRQAQDLLIWNPVVHVVGKVRTGFYPIYEGNYVSLGFVLGLSAFLFLTGAWLMVNYRNEVIEVR